MSSAAQAEEDAAKNTATAVRTYETALFAETHDLRDDFADALDDFIDNVMNDWLPYAQNVISAETAATLNRTTALSTLLTDVVKAGTKQTDDNRDSWHTFKLGMVGLEDGLMSACANDQRAQNVLATVNSYNTLAASPLSNFESQIGQQATTGMMGTGYMLMRPNTADDYIAWGTGIAGAVNPPSPSPPTVDAGQILQQIEQSVKPRNTIMLPLPGNPAIGPRSPDELLRQAIDPTGRMLPPTTLESRLAMIPTDPSAGMPSTPTPPGLEGMIPLYGPWMHGDYERSIGNYGWATVYCALAASDVFLVKSLVQGGA